MIDNGGFINDNSWDDPPVLVVMPTTFGGSLSTSYFVSANWKVLSSNL